MADYDKILQQIASKLGTDLSNVDNGPKQDVKNILKSVANQSSSSSTTSGGSTKTGLSGAISSVNSYVRALDKSSQSTVNWSTNILDLSENVVDLGAAILDLNFGSIFNELKDIASPFLEMDQALRNQVNRDLGLTGNLARGIRSTMIETAEETLRYGINVGDITDAYVSFVSTLGRAVPLNKELLEDITMTARASGISMSTAGEFLAKLENFGIGLNNGPKILEEMSDTARSMGLTTNKFMSYAAENLKLINTLGFEKGVRGFTDIAAKASAIGFNLQTAASSAEKLFDIDNAIEMAAQLNVLGGDFGKLGNAIDLMFSPTNDMEGFTNELMKATTQFVSFNAEKNTFDVSPLDLRRAREFAKATGMSLEEVIETGKRMSKMELIKDRISFIPNLSDEERDLIGSLGQINESGDVTIKGQLVSEMSSNQLTSAINSLKQEDAKGKMSQKDILNEQLNMFSKMNFYLKAIALELGAFDKNGGMFTLLGDNLNDLVYSVLGDSNEAESMLNSLSMGLINKEQGGFEGAFADFESKMNTAQLAQWGTIKEGFEKYRENAMDYIRPANRDPQGYGGAFMGPLQEHQLQVENNFQPVIYIDGFSTAFNRDEVKAIDQHGNEYKLRVQSGETQTNAVIGPKRQ